ncbi:MAG TPA: 4-(cytidine 5'-diphospho)-2-C-methyl-D-erythritol kinase [Candidatus Marinimicrobia bacterium]|nr:4-(cytidine 5'-diphospho)-2-C-methyl-D-erythritol kinase [Candidatus Neomarinimicrobiota bacterium]
MIKSALINTHHYTSSAKINLGLQVLNKREDGYHNLQSYFVEIDLQDELGFSLSATFQLSVEGAEVPDDDSNLISKAYKIIRAKTETVDTEYTIHLKKRIPIGGGLGGGSSNAAATLKALNQLWKLNLSPQELEKMGAELGADVPFFIKGGVQLIEGIGDMLTPIDLAPLEGISFLLVVPPIHISTPWAYGALNKSLQPDKSHPKFPPLSKPMKWELFDNDFERVIRKTYPEIGKIKENLQNAGALYAGLSGSGSTVFGVFDNQQKAEALLGNFSPYQTFLSSPVFRL